MHGQRNIKLVNCLYCKSCHARYRVKKCSHFHLFVHFCSHIVTPFAWVKELPLSNLNLQMPSESHSIISPASCNCSTGIVCLLHQLYKLGTPVCDYVAVIKKQVCCDTAFLLVYISTYTNVCRTSEIPHVSALFMLSQITAAAPAVSFTNTD